VRSDTWFEMRAMQASHAHLLAANDAEASMRSTVTGLPEAQTAGGAAAACGTSATYSGVGRQLVRDRTACVDDARHLLDERLDGPHGAATGRPPLKPKDRCSR
jgi:hypothetical protein